MCYMHIYTHTITHNLSLESVYLMLKIELKSVENLQDLSEQTAELTLFYTM